MMATLATTAAPLDVALTFDDVYTAHVAFVWRVLRALGVAPESIEDAAQDVFVVVHRRLAQFDGRAAVTTWLFAIARKIADRYRRKQRRVAAAPARDDVLGGGDPFAAVARDEAASIIATAMDSLDDDRRVVFALVELEQIAVAEVARMVGINTNTAYSRLRLAREHVTAFVRRRQR